MLQLRKTGDQNDEGQRDAAAQAAREVETLDPRSVLLTLQGWIKNGEVERVQRFLADYRTEVRTRI